ncbi:hypothetical protein C5167_035448 [Papaver somniferum]|uniref:Uncharacterized protein n=1 Tax=Papaver somniferum TaxID=3469 RepID=A0A4Y7KJ88_PAPSO|nr:hypothetical protein C5167_035448 [Papaver somniferum]
MHTKKKEAKMIHSFVKMMEAHSEILSDDQKEWIDTQLDSESCCLNSKDSSCKLKKNIKNRMGLLEHRYNCPKNSIDKELQVKLQPLKDISHRPEDFSPDNFDKKKRRRIQSFLNQVWSCKHICMCPRQGDLEMKWRMEERNKMKKLS